MTPIIEGREHTPTIASPTTTLLKCEIFTHLEDGTGTMHLQFLILTFQIPHEVFNHALSSNGKSITWLKNMENLYSN
jgi:hypothetical protein